jgi:hypothetical protein
MTHVEVIVTNMGFLLNDEIAWYALRSKVCRFFPVWTAGCGGAIIYNGAGFIAL